MNRPLGTTKGSMLRIELSTIATIGPDITLIAVVGADMGGKSSGIPYVASKLADRGYKVICCLETATKLINGGMKPGDLPWPDFQEEILLDIIAQEERFISIAKRYRDMGRKVVVLFDRGTMDGEAYVGLEAYGALLKKLGFTYQELCQNRYHAVMHLQTAAIGAEDVFTKLIDSAQNPARGKRTIAEARDLDAKTLAAWTRHPHPRLIDNSTDFDGKLKRFFREVCAVLGDPVPIEDEDKFLVSEHGQGGFDPASIPVPCFRSRIVQDYLVTVRPGEVPRIRSRSGDDGVSYYHTVKKPIGGGASYEDDKLVDGREYSALSGFRDPEFMTVVKDRYCFFYEQQFYEVDVFIEPRADLVLMEAERTDRAPELKLPPFINVIRKVTGDKNYSNKEIARRSKYAQAA